MQSKRCEISAVRSAINALIEAARPYQGFFPSVLDIQSQAMPFELPAAIPGQRDCDRSFPGSNLMHDHVMLKLMYDLAPVLGDSSLTFAADRYLERFTSHCVDATPTGLFPWGEHAFWNLEEDRPGSSYALARVATMATHDHLLQAPQWLWEKLWQLNDQAVERFCQALSRHFLDVDNPPEYNRHTNLLQPHHLKRKRGKVSCDFPRHGGLYIYDWCFAYARTGSALYRQLIGRMLDYWWDRRVEGRLLPIASRPKQPHASANTHQTLSLAVSLLEAAALVDTCDTALARVMRDRACVYLESVLNAPYDLEHGKFALEMDPDAGEVITYSTIWGSVYGAIGIQTANVALLLCCAYRITSDQRMLALVERAAAFCCQSQFPTDIKVPVKDAGIHLSLLADLYDITGDRKWLEHGLHWAEILLPMYCDHALPRGANGLSIYESQLLPGHLLRGLARLSLQSQGKDIGPDYTLR